MSFEQPVHSVNHPGGEPPTPTRTPSSPNFFNSSYQTPKQDSIFHDPLSPWPPALGSSPLFSVAVKTANTPPANGDSTPLLSEKPKTAEDVASEVAARAQFSTSNSYISLAPVDTSRQLPSSPQRSLQIDTNASAVPTSEPELTPSKDRLDQAAASDSMNSAGSIQTPPPTSMSTSRRRASEAHVARSARALASKGDVGFPKSAAGNSAVTAGTNQQVEESPSADFPNLQFSPDGFGFPLSGGPATAPVYPQHKLFWDPAQGMDTMNLDFPMDDTFTNFGIGLQKQLEPFVSEHDLSSGSHAPTTHASHIPGTSAINITNPTAQKHSTALNQTNISPSIAIMTQGSSRDQFTGAAVNPSLLFSSPHGNPLSSSQSVQDDALKPYAHQIQDAEYERELQSRRPKRKRGAELDSPAVKAATQALRGAEDGSSVDSADATVLASFGASMRPSSRHSKSRSGLTRHSSKGRESLSDLVDPSKRTSVTLTIDENGRAKTETKLVEDSRHSNSTRMNLDRNSSDSESSSSRSSQGAVFSQPSSFAYPEERQKRSKTPGPHKGHGLQSSHSHHSSYTSTLGSNSTLTYDSKRRQDHTDRRKQSQPQVHFEDSTSFIVGTLAEDDSEAETIVDTDEDNGNAASELRKVVRRRSNQTLKTNSLPRQSFADHRMPPSAPPRPYSTQQIKTPHRFGSSRTQQNISPTTITDPDIATPSTGGRTELSSNSITRCVCNATDGDGRLMVQCDSCKYWLHLDCVDLNHRNVPEIYLCIFCNHETPKVRGGRREPARAAFPPPSSPLAYKSTGHG